ncbi:MAG TPA: L-arabinose ABC transporter permease AraH [Armatimonadota bacterium]|jgi:L-arabinose transport system permease protein
MNQSSDATAPAGTARKLTLARALDSLGMLLIFAVLVIGCSVFVPNFATKPNVLGLALSVSMVGMVACTMLFCMASGDFDLSVEAMVAFAGVLAAVLINHWGNAWLGAVAAILACGVVGAINGVIIARVGINALITTLATMQIVRGLGFIVSNGSAVGITQESFYRMGSAQPLGIAMPIWITIVCFIIFGVLLHKTAFGRHTLAVGGNMEAARLSGVPVQRVRIIIFTLQGLMSGFAGVILASRLTSGQPNTSVGFALDVISACVLGGVSLSGGVGTMLGVAVGVLIMGTVQNAMNLMNVPTFWQYVARGMILLAAVIFDRWRRSRA